MICVSIGLPGALSDWCDSVVGQLVAAAFGSVEGVSVETPEAFVISAMRASAANILVSSREGSGTFGEMITRSGQPFLIALDEPRLALHDLVANRGFDFAEAVRAVFRSCTAIFYVSQKQGALMLRPEDGGARRTGSAIARYFSLPLGDAAVAAAMQSVRSFRHSTRLKAFQDWWDGLDNRHREIATGALQAFTSHFSGHDFGPITWERELLFVGDEPPREPWSPAAQPVDVAGPPRCLIFGPYLALPPGSWAATITLGFSQGAAEFPYLIEVAVGEPLASLYLEPNGEHLREINLHFSIAEALPKPAEVRVWSRWPGSEGQLAIGEVTLKRGRLIRPDTLRFFEEVLTPGSLSAPEVTG